MDSKFDAVLRPIRDLVENWNVDVSQILEEYIREITLLGIYSGGQAVSSDLNFAEAALLIQGSTTVYSKKVEYLHQLVVTTIDQFSSNQAENGVVKVCTKILMNVFNILCLKRSSSENRTSGDSSKVSTEDYESLAEDPSILIIDECNNDNSNIFLQRSDVILFS